MPGPDDSPDQALEQINSTAIAVEVDPRERADRDKKRHREPPTTRTQPNYHVIIWNDEEHSYEYVIELLMTLFSHSESRAKQITYEVDHVGKGIAWTCHQELAELKRDQILSYGPDWRMQISKSSIRSTIEPAPD